MNDFAFVAIILAFFAVAALFVAACDRIIGPEDSSVDGASTPEAEPESVAG
ncbi:MAG: hypothetical protein ACYDH6_21445 [Acidimicrobiales bacterium]